MKVLSTLKYQQKQVGPQKRGGNPPANNLESSFGTVRSFVLFSTLFFQDFFAVGVEAILEPYS